MHAVIDEFVKFCCTVETDKTVFAALQSRDKTNQRGALRGTMATANDMREALAAWLDRSNSSALKGFALGLR